MAKVFSIKDVKERKANTQEFVFPDLKYLKDGGEVPIKSLNNLRAMLEHYNITPKYNLIDKEILVDTFKTNRRSSFLTRVYDLQVRNGLNLNRNICDEYLL